MKRISVANDIVPIGEFKAGLSKWIKKSKSSGNPIVITQNGRAAAVVISPTDYDQLNELRQFVDSVKRGLIDSDKGNVLTTNQVHAELEKRREQRSVK
jgi:prevent-host-death family protein